jgi:hypothetical protein
VTAVAALAPFFDQPLEFFLSDELRGGKLGDFVIDLS